MKISSELAQALQYVKDGMSIRQAAKMAGVRRVTVGDYCAHYDITAMKRGDIKFIEQLPRGAPLYLSDETIQCLRLFCHNMDQMGYPIDSGHGLQKWICRAKAMELGESDISKVNLPSPNTVSKIRKQLHIPVRSIRSCTSADKIRQTKAKSEYLDDYFNTLEETVQKYKISEKNMYAPTFFRSV